MSNSIKIFTIVPCYNEADRLDVNIFKDFAKQNPNVHFCFVDDGSKDKTAEIISELSNSANNLHALIQEKNEGKAEAIRAGAKSVQKFLPDYDFIAYIDADLSVNLEELNRLIEAIQVKPDLKFLMGIRLARLGADINRNKKRHYLGRIFATVVSIMLREPTYDTQCGAKIIHKSITEKLFDEKFSSKWFFDVELIFRLKKYYPEVLEQKQALELPLMSWEEVGESRLKATDFAKAPLELLKIKSRYSKDK